MTIKRTVARLVITSLALGMINVGSNNVPEVVSSEKENNYIVEVKQDSVLNSLESSYDVEETTLDAVEDNVRVLSLTKTEAEDVERQKGVIQVEEDKILKASSSFSNKNQKIDLREVDLEWNKKIINSSDSNSKSTKRKVKIAVIDSGVDAENDIDLAGSISLVPGEENMSPLFMDGSGHGNSVAGLIAAKNNGEGITGINPNAEIYSIRVLDDNNESPVSRVVEGINYAIEQKVDIINMSFGMDSSSVLLQEAVQKAEKAGILVVAAAGNTGDNVQYPAAYDDVISVGSIDDDTNLAPTSARGEKVDVVAPGELVCSTGQFGDVLIESGTSLAAPQVAAVASKIMEENPNATCEDVKNALVNGANYNNESGYGVVDEKYVLKKYKEISISHRLIKKMKHKNNNEIESKSTADFIKGTWSVDNHEATVGEGHGNVKKGARYPDIGGKNFEKLGDNPWWHGGYKSNYIAAYIFITRMADDVGEGKNIEKTKEVSGLGGAKEKLVSSLKSVSWKKQGMDTKGKKRAFAWGMAMHALADTFAHSAFVKEDGKWHHLDHEKVKKKQWISPTDYIWVTVKKDKFACADETSKSAWPKRFENASKAVQDALNKYDKKKTASYTEFRAIKKSDGTYKINKLVKYVNSVKAGAGDEFENYSIEI
ncbi:S8 family peptidase [Eubacterium xylanophilum]|uniref:S8 family peptidase n=1 Tax=Eubacterium xylanophilum TaxID=39497 RepID=UPI00047C686A|nr:S8 family peptidase [Eubacterium xylanophilum]